MRALESRAFLRGFAAFVLFTGLAADFWRNSISWYGYGAIVLVIAATSTALLTARRRSARWRRVPVPLTAFLVLAAVSIAWSAYPGASALGLLAQLITTAAALAIALLLNFDEIVVALSRAIRAILALSILFELVVSFVIRGPVLPVWATEADRADPPVILYWSRDNLLAGERIQGIVGSWSLLGMVAVLGVIVFAAEVAAHRGRRSIVIGWLVLAVVTIVLTRSATIYLALVASAIVLVVVLIVRRAPPGRARQRRYGVVGVALVVIAAAAITLRTPLLAAMGKSPDLTGRLDIWDAVIGLARERPIVGWGWVSFWPPWTEPFRDLVRKNGVMQLHAHNGWLDVWLQLGIVGLVVFGALIATAAWRTWRTALDPTGSPRDPLQLIPLLVLTALAVQSLAESRILVEGGWMLLVIVSTMTATTRTPPPRAAQALRASGDRAINRR